MRCRGTLVLDLDGTLIDSAPDLLAAANALLSELDRSSLTLEQIVPMIGDGIPDLVRRALARAGEVPAEEELAARTDRFVEIYLDPTRPQLTRVYDGVPETLARLRGLGYRLAVCTNKIERAAVRLIRELSLEDALDAVVGGDSVPAKKPDPAHVLAAVDRLHGSPERTVTVGDSQNDMAAGLAAGTAVVAVTYGYGMVSTMSPKPRHTIDRFPDLPSVLQEIEAERCRPDSQLRR